MPANSIAHTCLLNTHPESRASVKLNSSDPFASPSVESNLLGHPDDARRLAQCMMKEREVAEVLSDEFGFNLTETSILGRDTEAELEEQVSRQRISGGM